MIRSVSFVAAALCLATAFGQPITDPELTRALDRASAAIALAQADAANNDGDALLDSLKIANERWLECFNRYRSWPTADVSWATDFDRILGELTSATNAITPGNSVPNAKTHLDNAASILQALRDRNGVPDVRAAMASLRTALRDLETATSAVQGKAITAADVANIQSKWQQAITSYNALATAVIETNALGLGEGPLNALRKLFAMQSIRLETVNNILKNPNTPALLAQLQIARDHFFDILEQLQRHLPADSPAKILGAPPSSSGQPAQPAQRPRLFPRLQR